VLAARIDVDTDRAIERLVAEGYRTHAGRFALSKPTGRACELGLDALAESLQGAALQELMLACHNAPGDPVGLAAFKVGDFMSAVGAGPENESIISRQLLTPLGEPKCFAQGPDLPTDDSPICRLEHARAPQADPARRARRAEARGPVRAALARGDRGRARPAVARRVAVHDRSRAARRAPLRRGHGRADRRLRRSARARRGRADARPVGVGADRHRGRALGRGATRRRGEDRPGGQGPARPGERGERGRAPWDRAARGCARGARGRRGCLRRRVAVAGDGRPAAPARRAGEVAGAG
jgi:hypothetical protein